MSVVHRPIIKSFGVYEEYPFEAIDALALTQFKDASKGLLPRERRQFNQLMHAIECILQITNRRIIPTGYRSSGFCETYRLLVGALNSDLLVDSSYGWKYQITRSLNALLNALQKQQGTSAIQTVHVNSGKLSSEIQQCVHMFNQVCLNEERVWLWRGWTSQSRGGATIHLPFFPIYKRLGRTFTDQLVMGINTYFGARRGLSYPWLKPLSQFIGELEKDISPDNLLDPLFTTVLWREFFVYFMVNGYADGQGASIETLRRAWSTSFAHFVTESLEPSGLFAKPLGQFPLPPSTNVPGTKTHVRTTQHGHEVKTKLITNIPLSVTDEQAIELLFHQVEADVNIFVRWAEWATADMWRRYMRRQALASQGVVREIQVPSACHLGGQRWLTNRDNPDHLCNAAATFWHNGFQTVHDINPSVLYPRSRRKLAWELALPITDSLFPHCVLLVADHQQITPAFLEQFELFDKNGKQSGFIVTDSGPVLVGFKHRRGPKHAQLTITLTERSAEIIRQIIAITQPLREYLRKRQDDRWRLLLLTCGQGFSYPASVGFLSQTTTIPVRVTEFAKSLGNTCDLDLRDRTDLVRRFSLSTLRASAAVLVYLETGSAEEMSKALGHAQYSPRLLSCYLPEPILCFFQERWVRIFQTGIIVEALQGSESLLHATSFRNIDELHEFLSHHALRTLPAQCLDTLEIGYSEPKPNSEVVFGVNAATLTALISLDLAVERASKQVCAKARYWSGIAKRLVGYLDTELCNRSDLQESLATARKAANPSLMEHLLYG